MQSKIVALLALDNSQEATLLVRRASGQFSLQRIDARVAYAARLAAGYSGSNAQAAPSLEMSAL